MTTAESNDDFSLSLEESLRIRFLEERLGLSLANCSKDQLIKVVALLQGKLNVAEDLLSAPPAFTNSSCSFKDIIVRHLKDVEFPIYKKNQQYSPQEIASEIEKESAAGQEWLIYFVDSLIQFLPELQVRPLSEEDIKVVELTLTSSKPSILMHVKLLKMLADRLNCSAYLSGQNDNLVFQGNATFLELVSRIDSLCRPGN